MTRRLDLHALITNSPELRAIRGIQAIQIPRPPRPFRRELYQPGFWQRLWLGSIRVGRMQHEQLQFHAGQRAVEQGRVTS